MPRSLAATRNPSTAANLWKNGGFESNLTGWSGVSGGTVAQVTTDSYFGYSCMSVTADGTNAAGGRTDTSNGGSIVVVAGQPYTASAYLKAPAGRAIKVNITTGNNSATGLDNTSTVATATGDWQRIVVTLASAATGAIRAGMTCGFSGTAPPNGTICLVDGVQFENRTSATNYIETNGAALSLSRTAVRSTALTLTTSGGLQTDATRAANVDGDAQTPPAGVGIWEATTNLITNGGFETNTTGWATFGTGVTLGQSAVQAKFGTKSLSVTTSSDNTGAKFTVALTTSTVYTLSAWVYVPIGMSVSLDTNGTSTGAIAGTGSWQRLTNTITASSDANLYVVQRGATGGVFYIDGVQLEKKAFATPYVNTTSATATRTVGAINTSPILLDPLQGWIAMCYIPRVSGNFPLCTFGVDQDFAKWVGFATVDLGPKWRFTGYQNNSQIVSVDVTGFGVGQSVVEIVTWTTSQLKISAGGSNFVSASIKANTFVPDIFRLGTNSRGDPFNGDILWTAAGRGQLTNADAATLNSTTAPTMAQLLTLNGGFASPSILWPAVTSASTRASRFYPTQARNPAS